MTKSRVLPTLFLVIVGILTGRPVMATDQLDLTVGLKTLPLLTTKIASPATVGIVFDATNADSKADADGIKAVVDGGLEGPGGVKLTAILVPTSDLGKLASAKIAIVAKGSGKGGFDAIAAAAASAGALSVSTDLDCVRANKCVLGIVSKPSVEIYFSRAAADAAKIGFAPAFTMLAKPI